jgi:pilus assembly protein CpaF
VIQIARLADGTRKVITISEITGMDNDAMALQDIFVFDRVGIDENGRVRGTFRATGVRPRFADRLATSGSLCVPKTPSVLKTQTLHHS